MSSAETGASLDTLRIPVGEVSLSSRLGGYYLDLTSVLPLVESGYHGPLDPRGVPMSRVGPGAPVYSVITIAQYALALHDACRQAESDALAAKLRTQLEAILEQVEWRGPRRGFSVHRWTDVKYRNLRAPWVSALSQGNAISALRAPLVRRIPDRATAARPERIHLRSLGSLGFRPGDGERESLALVE